MKYLNSMFTAASIAMYWTSYGFSVFSMGEGDWVKLKAGNATFGLFKSCTNGTCDHFNTNDSKIIGSRALIIIQLLIGFTGWMVLAPVACFVHKKTIWGMNSSSFLPKYMPISFLTAGVIYAMGLGIWTSYFCENSCSDYEFNYHYYTGWISCGTILFAILPSSGLVWIMGRE